jgi:hypothetical protein
VPLEEKQAVRFYASDGAAVVNANATRQLVQRFLSISVSPDELSCFRLRCGGGSESLGFFCPVLFGFFESSVDS